MATPDQGRPGGDAALRAEHDELARKLGTRRSIDEIRTAAQVGFATLLSLGLTLKFSWDRWGWSKLPKPPPRGRYPLLPLFGLVLFSVLLGFTVRAIRRARVHHAEEQRLASRYEELRRTLRLDP
jgi:hypothetical protein